MHGIKAWTGEPVWKFEMSKRAINTSAVMNGDDAIVTHSEENYDTNESLGLLAVAGREVDRRDQEGEPALGRPRASRAASDRP